MQLATALGAFAADSGFRSPIDTKQSLVAGSIRDFSPSNELGGYLGRPHYRDVAPRRLRDIKREPVDAIKIDRTFR